MSQFKMKPGHETRDAIVIFQKLQYKKKDLHFVFVYFEKAFYRDPRDDFW